jgi:hypothetical protein
MSEADATSRVFAFTDHVPLTPYRCLFAFYTPLALSESLTCMF